MSFIGIDVAKAQLEIACLPSGDPGRVPNDEAGVAELRTRCQALGPVLIVCEATGGYEAALVAALATAQLPVVVANPRQVRDSAKATGQLAKTDAIDARVLALFADGCAPSRARCPTRRSPPSKSSSRAAGSSSRCSPPSGIACSWPAARSDAISSSTSASSSGGAGKWTMTSTRR